MTSHPPPSFSLTSYGINVLLVQIDTSREPVVTGPGVIKWYHISTGLDNQRVAVNVAVFDQRQHLLIDRPIFSWQHKHSSSISSYTISNPSCYVNRVWSFSPESAWNITGVIAPPCPERGRPCISHNYPRTVGTSRRKHIVT